MHYKQNISVIRHFGKTFDYFLEVNLERDQNIKDLFGPNIDVKKICTALSAIYGVPIIPGKTLLFIDEIQESERAISSLRFFYEDYPELHVIAAGSLLEFALRELPSFGVGRIRSLFMYPFSFDEFLDANGMQLLREYKNQSADIHNPLPEAMHNQLIEQLRSYFLVGGMPDAVRTWIEKQGLQPYFVLQPLQLFQAFPYHSMPEVPGVADGRMKEYCYSLQRLLVHPDLI